MKRKVSKRNFKKLVFGIFYYILLFLVKRKVSKRNFKKLVKKLQKIGQKASKNGQKTSKIDFKLVLAVVVIKLAGEEVVEVVGYVVKLLVVVHCYQYFLAVFLGKL